MNLDRRPDDMAKLQKRYSALPDEPGSTIELGHIRLGYMSDGKLMASGDIDRIVALSPGDTFIMRVGEKQAYTIHYHGWLLP